MVVYIIEIANVVVLNRARGSELGCYTQLNSVAAQFFLANGLTSMPPPVPSVILTAGGQLQPNHLSCAPSASGCSTNRGNLWRSEYRNHLPHSCPNYSQPPQSARPRLNFPVRFCAPSISICRAGSVSSNVIASQYVWGHMGWILETEPGLGRP